MTLSVLHPPALLPYYLAVGGFIIASIGLYFILKQWLFVHQKNKIEELKLEIKTLKEEKLSASQEIKDTESSKEQIENQRKELENQNDAINHMLAELEEQNEEVNRLYNNLKVSEAKYREFAEMLPEIVFECDAAGALLFVNKKAFETLNINLHYINKGVSIFNFLHPDDIDRAKRNISLLAQGKELSGNEYRVVGHQGKTIIILAYTIPVLKDGILSGFRGMLIDISEKKKYIETIEIFEEIVSNMQLGLNVFKKEEIPNSKPQYILENINKASGRLMGFSHPSNIGKELEEISPIMIQNQLHKYFDTALKKNISLEIESFSYQPDQTQKPILLNLKIFPLSGNRLAMIIEDITSKLETESILRMTQFGIENAGDMIFWIDQNAQLLYANNTAISRLGYSKEEILTKKMPDIDPRINMMQWYELIQILENKNILTIESEIRDKQGNTYPIEISLNKFIYEGGKKYFAFIKDISDRKKYSELEQKIQLTRKSAALKQQFLANMSHEIRTPMTGIMGMTSLLMRSPLDESQLEYVKSIKMASENLMNIINDVLDLSKIEAGKLEIKPTETQLGDLVSEIRDMFDFKAKQKDVFFEVHLDPNIPEIIEIDQNRLKQIMNNLLSNAFKFTDEGKVSMAIRLVDRKNENLTLVCEVEDTGTGISEMNQKQIFEKFTQLENSLVRPFEGTGLGLAISQELTRLLGGDISVESQEGKGSLFMFTFMARSSNSEAKKKTVNKNGAFENMNLNILVAEDKAVNQKVIEQILQKAGCTVKTVKNGKEAVQEYNPGDYDIILMDIQMPIMDGITAFKILKEMHKKELCPVISLSANALEGDAERYINEGLNDYISKPFRPETLYEKLLYWSKKKIDA